MGAEYIEIKPKQKSLAKARAVQGSDLKESEKFVVEPDKPLLIDNYDVGEHGHYAVHLWGDPHETVGDSANIWPGHYESFPELLKITKNTVLKKNPKKQSGDLSSSELMPAKKGQLIIIRGAGEVVNKCVEVTLVTDDGKEDKWWAFLGDEEGQGHCSVVGTEPTNNPKDEPTPRPEDKGKLFNIPGIGQVHANDAIIPGGSFKYYEAFRPDGHRIPTDASLAVDVKRGAEMMQWAREKLGNLPLIITSWHRPYHINRRVGGSSQSFHVRSCSAVDFYPVGMSVEEAYRILEPWWGSKGGLARKPGSFLHLDRRSYRARWTY